jgi:hypothetical protein
VRLPARMTVVELLENYIAHNSREELTAYTARISKQPQQPQAAKSVATRKSTGSVVSAPSTSSGKVVGTSKHPVPSSRSRSDLANEDMIKTFGRINRTKKICEDVRVMFDFLLSQMLLYEHEMEQYKQFLADYTKLARIR